MGVKGAPFVTVMILAIETATSVQSLALVDGERVLAHHSQEAAGSHTKSLIPAIDQLLSSVSFNVSHLEGVAVSIGPGSFTGLRVGLATALGFRLTLGIPHCHRFDPGGVGVEFLRGAIASVPFVESQNWRGVLGKFSLGREEVSSPNGGSGWNCTRFGPVGI